MTLNRHTWKGHSNGRLGGNGFSAFTHSWVWTFEWILIFWIKFVEIKYEWSDLHLAVTINCIHECRNFPTAENTDLGWTDLREFYELVGNHQIWLQYLGDNTFQITVFRGICWINNFPGFHSMLPWHEGCVVFKLTLSKYNAFANQLVRKTCFHFNFCS